MATDKGLTGLNKLFKEIYADKLDAFIPTGVGLIRLFETEEMRLKREYGKEWEKVRNSKLGKLLSLEA